MALGDDPRFDPDSFRPEGGEAAAEARAARFIAEWYGLVYPEIFGWTPGKTEDTLRGRLHPYAGGPLPIPSRLGLRAGLSQFPTFTEAVIDTLKSEFTKEQVHYIFETLDMVE